MLRPGGSTSGFLVSGFWFLVGASGLHAAPKPTPTPAPRRVAVRYEGIDASAVSDAFRADSRWARRSGVPVEAAAEGTPVPKAADAVHLCVLPSCGAIRGLAARFPIAFQDHGFAFDGRAYSGRDDAVLLADPSRGGEVLVAGLSPEAVIRLAQRRVFLRERSERDYVVVSGGPAAGLRKTGRFTPSSGVLAIDRASDEDEIAEREAFYASLGRQKKGAVAWECAPSDKAACEKWQPVAAKLAGKGAFAVRVFPDTVRKARYTGSSRPADVVVAPDGGVRVEVDASAPSSPDLVTPALAAGAAAAARPALAARPLLLWAVGARRAGTWWGRDVRSFAAFTRAAGVEPAIGEVLGSGDGVSPILGAGAAASWLDAGVRLEGEAAVERALRGPEPALGTALGKWRDAARRQTVRPPARRPLPEGFLAGVSYAMRNTLGGGYASAASAKALERLRNLGANSVSVMPFAFSRDEHSPRIDFVHESPRGETDESIVRAVADARGLGMSSMVKPQLWVAEQFVGRVAMPDEDSWRAWFDAYRRYAVHQAVVAEAAGAAIFCVGTELSSTEAHDKDWRDVIAAVRLATGAPLVYAANWGARVPEITFWDSLDAIGADFYDPLGKGNSKLADAALEEGVRRAARPLADASRKYSNRPVLLTEAGYPLVRAAWLTPHDEDSPRPYSADDPARCVAAVYRALGRETWWKGVYWWKAFSDGAPAEEGEKGFNFVGTPVEKAIAEGWKGISR